MRYRRTIALIIGTLTLAYNCAMAAGSAAIATGQTASQAAMITQSSRPGSASLAVGGAQAVQEIPAAAPTGMPIAPGAQLTLRQAISIAIRYHPRIKEAAENTSAAAARVGVARSFLGPQVFGVAQDLGSTVNGIANTSYYNPEAAFPRMTGRNHDLPSNSFSQSTNTDNNYMGGLAVSQFLFDFGRHRGFVTQRRFEAAAVQADEQMAKLDLIFQVSERYFEVLQAKELIRVYKKALEQRRYHLHEAQVKAGAGLRPQLDVYVTQAEVQRAQLHLVDAKNAYDDAKVALNNALGLSDRAPEYHIAGILSYQPVTESLRSLLSSAMRLRPDLLALDDQARALGAQVVEYKSDYYPTVNALGGYSAMGTGLPAANNFNVGIVITWPIFNSFLTTDEVAEAKAQQRAARYAIQDLEQRIILQVQTSLLNWQAALQRIKRAAQALAASRAELELAEKRYEAGLSDIVELEDAQRHYTYDDAGYANALYGFSVAKAAVDRATGRALAAL